MKKLITLFAALFLSAGTLFSQCNVSYTFTISSGTADFTSQIGAGFNGPLYYWDFGDGSTSWNQDPSHTYSANGMYLACLTVYDSLGSCGTQTFCDTVIIQGLGGGCSAASTYTPDSSGTIYFSGSASGGIAPYTYYWEFGDGNTSTSMNSSNTYASSGWYWACLTITDATGCSDTQCDSIYANGSSASGCNLSMNAYAQAGNIYGSQTSTGVSSTEWYVWDSNWNLVHNTANTSLLYSANPGMYQVCLYGYDSTGNWCDSICTSVYVDSLITSGCQANFYAIDSGNSIFFVDNSSGGSGFTYFWDFGDGNTSNQQYPVHSYTTPGTYTVCLTISDSTCSDTYCDVISVTTVGIDDQEVISTTLYPNPATENLTIEISSGSSLEIIITDLLGKVVSTSNLQGGYNMKHTIDVSSWSQGVYNVTVLSETGRQSNRFVKQ